MSFRAISNFTDRTEGLNPDINIFVNKLIDKDSSGLPVFHGEELRSLRGTYRQKMSQHFKRPMGSKLVVEIGSHLGKTTRDMGASYPEVDFVGIDMTFKRAVTTAERAQKANCKNIFAMLANAKNLPELFAPEEVHGFVIFFPDPWVKKKRQQKNRLLDASFIEGLSKVLAPGGFVWVKSDQESYVETAAKCMSEAGFIRIETPQGLLADTFQTTFERKFTEQNLPTFATQWFKPFDSIENERPEAKSAQFSWETLGPLDSSSPVL